MKQQMKVWVCSECGRMVTWIYPAISEPIKFCSCCMPNRMIMMAEVGTIALTPEAVARVRFREASGELGFTR